MMLGARTSAWARAGGVVPTARDYVQDGLVAMWDGIENAGWGVHDPNATVWKDLSGNNNNIIVPASWNDSGFKLDGVSTTIDVNRSLIDSVTQEESTLEIVFSIDDYIFSRNVAFLSVSGSQQLRQWLFFGWGDGGFRGGIPARWNNDIGTVQKPVGLLHFTIVNSNGLTSSFLNGQYLSSVQNTSGQIDKTEKIIFCGDFSSYWSEKIKGTYSAIRLRNKALSVAKISANYAIDKARFNLP